MSLVKKAFYERDVLTVSRALLGKILRRDEVALRITEVEAYAGPEDTASHARFGLTERSKALFGPPGRAYVYLCYGIHNMLNVIPQRDGVPSAVLVRACEVVDGMDVVRDRRNGMKGPALLTGPGKVGAALDLDTSWTGHVLYEKGGLELHDAPDVQDVLTGARVGIDYAEPRDRDAHWRFAVAGTTWVSHRKTLIES